MKLEACNVSARPKVDYGTDIGVRSLLAGERREETRSWSNLSVDRGRDVGG